MYWPSIGNGSETWDTSFITCVWGSVRKSKVIFQKRVQRNFYNYVWGSIRIIFKNLVYWPFFYPSRMPQKLIYTYIRKLNNISSKHFHVYNQIHTEEPFLENIFHHTNVSTLLQLGWIKFNWLSKDISFNNFLNAIFWKQTHVLLFNATKNFFKKNVRQ